MEQGERRMTKEELEKEVTRLRNENLDIINKYTRFAETDRKTIADLEAQIEKMKCCQNCKHHYFMGNDLECKLIDCDNNESWELAK